MRVASLALLLGLGLGFCFGFLASPSLWHFLEQAETLPPQPSPIKKSSTPMTQSAIRAEVLRIIDGDTFEVRATLWDGLTKTATIRLAGVNTPEKRKRAGCRLCAQEKKLAARAETFVRALIGKNPANGKPNEVYLSAIGGGLYNRFGASIATKDGTDIAQALIEAGLGLPYDGVAKACWCGVATKRGK